MSKAKIKRKRYLNMLKNYKKDMEIFEQGTRLDVIISKILEKPEDFYIRVCEELAPEERLYIIKNLKNKCCNNCSNPGCRVENNEKDGLNELGELQGSSCLGWQNYRYIGMAKVLRINDINKLKNTLL